MGDLLQQMAVTFVTHEAEAAREAERRQAEETAEDADSLEAQERADAIARAAVRQKQQRKPMWRVLLKKQLSLPAKLKRSVRQKTQQQKQQEGRRAAPCP